MSVSIRSARHVSGTRAQSVCQYWVFCKVEQNTKVGRASVKRLIFRIVSILHAAREAWWQSALNDIGVLSVTESQRALQVLLPLALKHASRSGWVVESLMWDEATQKVNMSPTQAYCGGVHHCNVFEGFVCTGEAGLCKTWGRCLHPLLLSLRNDASSTWELVRRSSWLESAATTRQALLQQVGICVRIFASDSAVTISNSWLS